MKRSKLQIGIILFILFFTSCFLLFAGESFAQAPGESEKEGGAEGNITMDFKNTDINNVLRILSYKSGINIVAGEDVQGMVTIKLADVPWEKALSVILSTYGFGYERDGNVITVTTFEKLLERKKAELELKEVQPIVTRTFALKFLDAADAKNVLEPQLSPRGKITVLETTGQIGWEFGGENVGKRKRLGSQRARGGRQGAGAGVGRTSRSNILVISDIPPFLKVIERVLKEIDVQPKQILIEARLIEVSEDTLRDIGLDWGTGTTGAESTGVTGVTLTKDGSRNTTSTIGGRNLTSQVNPSVFNPKAGITAANTGLKAIYSKLTGNQFQVILRALAEDVTTNTLSAPRIMTLNNQEATILVGKKYPIIKTETEEGVASSSLDYYQNIGIQLNVVPRISGENYINMIVHPAVTSSTETVSITDGGSYPIILTREAETQILIKDGETIVIGGLLKDVKAEGKFSVPVLGKIPLLGLLFQRNTTDIEKIDLLIFITAHIVKTEEEFLEEKEI